MNTSSDQDIPFDNLCVSDTDNPISYDVNYSKYSLDEEIKKYIISKNKTECTSANGYFINNKCHKFKIVSSYHDSNKNADNNNDKNNIKLDDYNIFVNIYNHMVIRIV